MKKKLLLSLVCFSLIFAGTFCFAAEVKNPAFTKAGKIKVVTTIFPIYDWVKNIAGENVDLTYLLEGGVDLHSWQPSAQDMVKITTSDVFIYVGGESDAWAENALKNAMNKDLIAVNLMDMLADKVRTEEIVEGMQAAEHDHDHDDDHEHDIADDSEHDHDDEEEEYDEHVWLSLKNAAAVCDGLSEIFCSLLPSKADTIRSSAGAYIKKLSDLDKEYERTIKNSKKKVILVADRFPFRYLVDDYDLDYYAAFVGCSAETEASFKTVAFLSGKSDELGLNVILVMEKSDKKIADTVIKNSRKKDKKIMTLDSMQSVTAKQVADGASYYEIMKENLAVLKKALN
ncbi:zinc ABC transporter substrate-binding protein [Treponema parvum]|uniref:Zinc ABC transporter substrate-binding protein n=1 Tax=Treponema parvum TaxID=138851 RepID=A0A975F3L7_9SPIR|nr:metal ABC transporter substrate-binding protein [Treponema parvum]QTQ13750.1 zinc ABC transporter substrate-binding protein [Treponema parvum]